MTPVLIKQFSSKTSPEGKALVRIWLKQLGNTWSYTVFSNLSDFY